LPGEVRSRLAAEVDALRRVAADVAWVGVGNLHVTLKFLGRVESVRLGEVEAALAGAAAGTEAFELAVQGLGAFPTPARARVIWAGVGAGAGAAEGLAARVDEALAGLGFPRETRPFAPHVTLGRVREPRGNAALAAALASGAAREFGHVDVQRVCLMRSELSPRGARHSELRALALGTPPLT
jgi:2'-5' RNA ligase